MTGDPGAPAPRPSCLRHLAYRKEVVRTTWKLRAAVLLLAALLLVLGRGFWASLVANSLVCASEVTPADVILVENFGDNYLLFERAERLRRAGMAPRVVVTVMTLVPDQPHPLSADVADLLCRTARIPQPELLKVAQVEPITLNMAHQVRDFLVRERLRSVLLVTAGFRSRRSSLIYGPVLEAAGIRVGYVPVFGTKTPANWTRTWHGIQEVTQQLIKLQLYRFYFLRRAAD
jgi:hypothetical protein